MPTKAKEEAVAELKELLARSPFLILSDYRGLDVGQISALRRRVRAAGGEYRVVKNRLLARAVAEGEAAAVTPLLEGPTAVAFCGEDAPQVAKVLADYAEEVTPLSALKGAFVDGHLLDVKQCEALAKVPPKPVLLGELVASLQYPVTALAQTLSMILAELSLVLDALVEKRSAEAA